MSDVSSEILGHAPKQQERNVMDDERLKYLFAAIDEDKNGVITIEELNAFVQQVLTRKPVTDKRMKGGVHDHQSTLSSFGIDQTCLLGSGIQHAFASIDIDHSGDITLGEMKVALMVHKGVNTELKRQKTRDMSDIQLFKKFCEKQESPAKHFLGGPIKEKEIQDLFDAIDYDHDGQVSFSELETFLAHAFGKAPHPAQSYTRLLSECGLDASMLLGSQLKDMFERIDADHSGELSVEELRIAFIANAAVLADREAAPKLPWDLVLGSIAVATATAALFVAYRHK